MKKNGLIIRKKNLLVSLLMVAAILSFVSCDLLLCEHQFTKTEHNATQHWAVCEECGEEVSGSREDHSFVSEVTSAATCTEDGEKTLTCSECGYSKTEAITASHTLTAHDAVAKTCTTDGNSAYWSCSVCEKYFSDAAGTNEIDEDSWVIIKGHTLTSHTAVAKTCTADGNSAYWSCSGCNKYFSDAAGTNEIDEDSWVITKEHTLTSHDAVAKTCTTDGNSAYWSCSVCDKYFSDAAGTTEIVEDSWVISKAHTLTSHNAVAKTCTTDGNSAYWSCSVCDKFFSDAAGTNEIDEDSWVISKGHTLTSHPAVGKTCTTDGNSAYWSCSGCNKYFSDATGTNEIDEDSWVITKEHTLTSHDAVAKTCTTDGNSAYWSCSVCDKYFSDAAGTTEIVEDSWVISKAHTLTSHNAVAKTCTTDGNSAYWSCSVCDKYFSDAAGTNEIDENSWVIPKSHQLPTTWSYDLFNHWKVCSVCNEKISSTVQAHNKNIGESCTVCGVIPLQGTWNSDQPIDGTDLQFVIRADGSGVLDYVDDDLKINFVNFKLEENTVTFQYQEYSDCFIYEGGDTLKLYDPSGALSDFTKVENTENDFTGTITMEGVPMQVKVRIPFPETYGSSFITTTYFFGEEGAPQVSYLNAIGNSSYFGAFPSSYHVKIVDAETLQIRNPARDKVRVFEKNSETGNYEYTPEDPGPLSLTIVDFDSEKNEFVLRSTFSEDGNISDITEEKVKLQAADDDGYQAMYPYETIITPYLPITLVATNPDKFGMPADDDEGTPITVFFTRATD